MLLLTSGPLPIAALTDGKPRRDRQRPTVLPTGAPIELPTWVVTQSLTDWREYPADVRARTLVSSHEAFYRPMFAPVKIAA